MKNVAQASIGAVLLLAMTFAAVAPADASGNSFIRMRNETDKYVWLTVYSKPSGGATKTIAAWCIAPGVKNDNHGFVGEIKEVRAEVSAGGCQHNPMLLDKTWSVPASDIVRNDVNFWGMVKYAGGVLTFSHESS